MNLNKEKEFILQKIERLRPFTQKLT